MKDKFQSLVGMRGACGWLNDPLITHLSPTNHPLKHYVWKVLTMVVLLFTFGIGQMWGTATNFHDFVAAGDTIIDIEGSGSTPSTKMSTINGTDWAAVSTSAKNNSIFRMDPSTEEVATSKTSVYGTKLGSSAKSTYKVTGVSNVIFYVGTGTASRIAYLDVTENGKSKVSEAASVTLSDKNNAYKMSYTLDASKSYTLEAYASSDIFCYAVKFTVASKCTKPGTPTALAAGSVTHNSASLSWTAGANSDGFKIYIEKKSDKTKVLDWTDCATNSYAASGLDPETTYTFKVKAKGASGYCDLGDEASADFATEVDPSATTYKVTLVPAGGTISDATGWTLNAGNYEKEVSDGAELALPTFTKANRTFKTWRKSGPVDVTSPITVTADVTLTAVWTATVEQVLYSWEGGSPATEVGGTAVTKAQDGTDAETSDINVDAIGTNATYKSIKVQGKISSNAWSGNYIQITTDEAIKTGDKVKITACTTKGDTSKKGSAQIRVGTSATGTQIVTDGGTYNDIAVATDVPVPNTKTFTISAEGINTSTLSMTRQSTNTNCWVTKLQIVRETQVEEGDLLTVTFDTKGGSSISPVMVASGQTIAKPADPTKEHNRFNEWQLSGSAYNFSTPVTSSITLDATWTQLYTISFANGGGSGDAPAAVADKAQGETFEVPANTFTAPASKEFDKWNDGSADYAPGATYTVGTANVILTAQWKALTAKYTVHYMDEDGTTPLGADELVEVGQEPAGISATKPLFTLASWQLSGSDIALDDASWASVAANAEVTLTARWAKAYGNNVDFEAYILANTGEADDADKAEAYVIAQNYALSTKTNTTFDANNSSNNGAYAGLKIKNSGTTLSWNVVADKVVELKAGVMVANGSLSINGGAATTIDGGSTSSGDNFKIHYFYSDAEALYEFTTSNGSAEVIKAITMRDPYTVSFEAHGDADPSALPGQPSVTLPAATNGTASLLGWFDAETGGNKIGDAGDSYTPTANITLHAQWEAVSTDARLASITFSSDAGTLSPTFDPEVVNYTYTMPYPTAAVPTITDATSVSAKAKTPVIDAQAANWGDVAHIHGVAESDDTKDYYITMKIAPKDGVCIIKVATTGGTNKTVTGLYAGDGDVNLSSSKKMDNGKYIGFTLDGTTLQAGDQINVHTSTAANTGGSHIIFYDNMTDKNELYETGEIGGLGDNIFTINAAMVGATTAYVYRSNADAAHQWNGCVDFIEVTRAMNPVLTAIAINGEAGTINESAKTVAVELQPGYDLAALTIVPTIVSNTAEADVVKTVESNSGNWVIGDNTYRLTDKDGDYTEYTVTLSEGEVKYTVSFNTHGGSAVESVEVVDGQKLAAAPADPTKEDYLFQGWAETEDGTIVDVTSFTITADKEFHAVWAADGAIKLLDGATVNHTNFITGVTADETVEFQGNTVNYAKFSGTVSGVNGVKDLTRVIAYNATTNKTKIRISAHNNSTSARSILVKGLVEGADAAVDLATIALGNKEDKVSDWIEFDNAANRTIYIMVSSSAGDVYFTQVKVIESGETPMKQAGEAGYSLNLNKGRFFGPASTDLAFEGLDARLSGDYTALNSGYAKLNATSMSFTVASDMLLTVTANNNKTYYVTKDAAGTDNETAKTGASEFNLTAGTWFITAGGAEVQFTNIAFSAPKCEQPTVVDMESIGLCEGDAFIALTVSASVSDEGTLHYAWFKEAGATDEAVGTDAASFTPEADGEYYVIVTNQKTGYSDNSETSNTVSVEHFAAAVITTAPADVAKEVGQEATLSVVATGKNCTYEWFTCDDALGTNPVAIVPAETEASLTVTVAAGEQYYMVVVSSDCGAPVSAVAKVAEWRELAPANVTGSMTWDWTSAAWNGITGDIAFANTGVEELMANVNAKVPCVDGENGFRADMLYGTGQYVWRSGNKFFQGTKIRFITTVPGKLVVRYRNTSGSTNTRTIKITNNGEVLPADGTNTTNSFKNTNPMVVKAGEVIIEGIASEENGMTRIEKIIFDADLAPTQAEEATLGGYERDVTEGRYGTICLPKAGVMVGAAIFELAYYSESDNKIFMDQVMSGEMVAGRPYVFLPNEGESTLGVYYTDDEAVAAGDYRGLYGYYDGTDDALQLDPGDGHYILYNNQFRKVTVSHVWIDQNRAYFKIGVTGGIPTNVVAPLPGRRRMSIGAAAPQVTTGMDELNAGEAPVKVLINGELFILRGEKMFDATGRLIK